jgi:branched-chain amino acid transport system ATP-binding protein
MRLPLKQRSRGFISAAPRMLEIGNLEAGYGEVRILHGITMSVPRGSVTALLGANGAGKTTLMRTIAGLLTPSTGRIRLTGTDITRLPSNERVECGIALVPEGRLLFPGLSVAENLRLGGITRRGRHARAERTGEMYALFPRLAEREYQTAGTLSGGEQQMLAIARALMSRPKLLLLDEPTLGLAPAMCITIYQTIADLAQRGLTILMAEQNVPQALALASTGHVIENGRIVLSASAAELSKDPRVRIAYMGI